MSVLKSIFAASTSISDLKDPRYWLVDALNGKQTTAGETVSPDTAMTVSTYWACIRNIAEDCGKLPAITYKRLPDGGKERAPSHPSYKMFHDSPNPEMTAMAFIETLLHYAIGWGGGIAEIQRNGRGDVTHLWPIHPSRVNIGRDKDNSLVYEIQNDQADPTYLYDADVFHVHGLSKDGVSGYSVAQLGVETLGLTMAAQTFGAAFFGNGSAISGILSTPKALGPKGRENLRKAWKVAYGGGAKNALNPAVLEDDLKWQTIGIPPDQAQFLETRNFQVEEICRWCRMPPHKVQHMKGATFSNIESQAIEYVGDTLLSWIVRVEQEAKRKIFTRKNDPFFLEFLITGLLRGDSTARSAYYREQFMIGALSQNEIRKLENRNPTGPDGDIYYIPLNMQRAEDAARGTPQKEQVAGPPDPKSTQIKAEDAIYPVFLDAATRVLNKETKAATRAFTRCNGDKEEFKAWAEKFYSENINFIHACFLPPAQALLSVFEAKQSENELDTVLIKFTNRYIETSKAMLSLEASHGDGFKAKINAWPEMRARNVANLAIEAVAL